MAYYWYQSDPQLYQMEVAAMKKFFPSFTINQLQDGSGRLYWRGKVQPTGEGGMIWDIMLIYKNTHPHVGSANAVSYTHLENSGGTAYTANYAKTKKITVINIARK